MTLNILQYTRQEYRKLFLDRKLSEYYKLQFICACSMFILLNSLWHSFSLWLNITFLFPFDRIHFIAFIKIFVDMSLSDAQTHTCIEFKNGKFMLKEMYILFFLFQLQEFLWGINSNKKHTTNEWNIHIVASFQRNSIHKISRYTKCYNDNNFHFNLNLRYHHTSREKKYDSKE